MIWTVTIVYVVVTALTLLFAVHEARLLWWFLRQRSGRSASGRRDPGARAAADAGVPAPFVTVQVPLYNEPGVAARVLEAVAALDYPRDRLEIQILDDSTDSTIDVVDDAVAALSGSGLSLRVIRRARRAGFKAGALAGGLAVARGELVAIFDSDFDPPDDFLRRLVLDERVFDDPTVGFVQARWSFSNRNDSRFTRVQAMLLERHFLVEKPARVWKGRVTSFNGSAGIWRTRAIRDAGGWSSDTLTEDLDLSYRASLRGYHGAYVAAVSADSELPTDALAFKLQQRRWTRGSIQCLRKLLLPIVRSMSRGSPDRAHDLDELVTLAGYAVHPVMLANLLLWPWAVLVVEPRWVFLVGQLALTLASVVGPAGFLLAALERGERPSRGLVRDIALAMAVGIGLMVSNTAALFAGILGRSAGTFERTPKKAAPTDEHETPALHWTFFAELFVIAYAAGAAFVLARAGQLVWAPPCLLWGSCLAAMVGYQLAALSTRQVPPRRGRIGGCHDPRR